MVLEVSQIAEAAVVSADGKKLASIDKIIFDGKDAKIAGFQIKERAVISRFAALDYLDILTCERQTVVVDKTPQFSRDLKHFDELRAHFGNILNVTAKTESGLKIGKVKDLLFEIETGLIIRFYIGTLLRERIIPRQYLVSITPKAIIFKDIVGQPIFDQVATLETNPVQTS